ncbi:acyl-CoA dehydrogenase [Cupriavidus sp. USMAA2-4]|uniref:acyl-CoA dehydrogenase family protein n=1 Tax=Cupriavidus sp. USMAA2-4 TaxID=876364 RepID=UPI0008A67640|nr:acyl-CoA dehydrogenase family protein [Cupriavidus sp. USMAA2-4]AOY90728.1 acyl-CoA dehydrogenase [Cupriavidus sp. USMAA2-4]
MSAVSDKTLQSRFASLFARLADGAVERERNRRLAFDEVKALQQAGFGALRAPVEQGGAGATIRQLFDLLIGLGAADSNLPQAFRLHLVFVEEQRLKALQGSAKAREWLAKAAEGKFFGGAATELGEGAAQRYRTAVSRTPQGWRLNGEKFYSTGALYADYLAVAADRDGERVTVVVPAEAPGLTQRDDWDGFGQRLTVSGHSTFVDVPVREDDISEGGYGSPGRTWATAYLQLILLASLAGIARRVEQEAIAWVRPRTRTFSHAPADLPKDDPLVQETIGKLSAAAFGARAAVLAVAETLDAAIAGGASDPELVDNAERAAAQAQDVVISLALDASSRFFELGGASLTSSALAHDRHWRNARTLAAHNPLAYKLRALGANLLNGDPLPYQWSAGVRRS